jgi:integrase
LVLGVGEGQGACLLPYPSNPSEKAHYRIRRRACQRIKAADLENLQAKRKAERKADSTVDQEIGAAWTVINKAFDNNLVSRNTLKAFKKVRKLLKRNANARNKIISPEQFQALLNSENLPLHTWGILATGFNTGMRKGEILSLIWHKMDMKNRVIRLEAEDTKAREAQGIPICDELYAILRMMPRALHDDHVFLYKGKPVRDIRSGLKQACRTGLCSMTFSTASIPTCERPALRSPSSCV